MTGLILIYHQILNKYFKSTHNIKSILSVGDNIKAKTYSFNELKNADLLTKFRVFEEGRRFVDEWLIMYPKINDENSFVNRWNNTICSWRNAKTFF